jgi:hypothetical protein
MFMRARDLFRESANSGQVGELLVYFLLETVLHAPQALKKMPMTTNPNEERKGSDGVHLRWDEGVLELIFAESKIWKSFPDALRDAFASMEQFHDSRTKQHEVNAFTSGFSNLDSELQKKVLPYIEGDNVSNCRLAHRKRAAHKRRVQGNSASRSRRTCAGAGARRHVARTSPHQPPALPGGSVATSLAFP